MAELSLLYKKRYEINENIKIVIPTVGEIMDDEDGYYNLVTLLTAAPIDMMVQLDDAGVDFDKINDYELFLLLFNGIKDLDTHLVFQDLDLSKFIIAVNTQNNNVVLYDPENNITIDRAIHGQIATVLRKINNLSRDRRKPANKEAKAYMIERARTKMRRHRNRKPKSQLEELIIAMVNAPEWKYDFEGTRNLTIFQFNESVQQVIKRVAVDSRMYGVYSGTVDSKKMSQDDLNWLVHK